MRASMEQSVRTEADGVVIRRALVVDDSRLQRRILTASLQRWGFEVQEAASGDDALRLCRETPPDLVMSDWMMPGLNGLEFCREFRQMARDSYGYFILLTSKSDKEEVALGLDAGADDYLAKPFAFEELLARVRALLRRKSESKSPILKVADLELDPISRRVSRQGKSIRLTTKEYALLEYLMRNPGKVLSRTLIGEHVWDMNFDPESNVIDVYISHLRSKVDKGFDVPLMHTLRGQGYLLADDSQQA